MDELKPTEELDYCQICGETITAGELVCNDCRSGRKGRTVMERNEPSTGELIEALRCDGVIKPCEGCFFAFQIENCAAMGCRTDDMFGLAADRLESQEREIKCLQGEMFANALESAERIATLTARAEQAEARENAMIDFMYAYCQFCEHRDAGEEDEPCCSCENVTHDGRECKWQLLRLPQDGEGV